MKSERSSSGRRRRVVAFLISWSGFFWLTLSLLLFSCFRLSSPPLPWWSCCSSSSPSLSSSTSYLTLSTLLFPSRQHHHRHDDDGLHHHQLVATWPHPVMEAISESEGSSSTSTSSLSTPPPTVSILHSVTFPDQISIFLKYPPSAPLFPADAIDCVYLLNNSSSSSSTITLRPLHIDSTTGGPSSDQIVRCPSPPRGYSATVGFFFFNNKKNKRQQQESGPGSLRRQAVVLPLPPGPTTYRWDWLAYEATIDHNDDNTTVVFAKGFNLRPGRLSDPTRFQCVYGWDLSERPRTRFFLRSEVLSIGQEVVRCKTPLAVLNGPKRLRDPIKVSVRLTGRATLPSIARPVRWQPDDDSHLKKKKKQPPQPQPLPLYEMCVCTMVRNQARFLREWVTYHSRVGVQRWFIYDNNSDDDVDEVIRSLNDQDYNISKHVWPWIKSQEAGFAHCALRARGQCNWVGFIDVDEFFHFPSSSARLSSLHDVLRNYSNPGKGKNVVVGEIRTFCYNFGPSGLRRAPAKGVTVGYTCRMAVHERHKSVVRPDALSPTLMNVVHHFQLREGFRAVTLDRPVMVINHYKYQVWQVFKEKFYRRVATYVSDWTDEANVGSKDRAPGLGTQAVEPPNWPAWFCEVNDTRLRDVVLNEFADPDTRVLPWEESNNSRTDQ